ncbi:MAG: glutaredoxin family protein [Gammaproteobacteria bacterium]|nr:glutaredoxin family protein [Gammaproteobacteria bacterium]
MRQKTLSALLFSILCLVLTEAQAAKPSTTSPEEAPVGKKLYKWVDHQGNVFYHDQPPPEGSQYKVEERILKGEKTPSKKSADESDALRTPVVVYMIPKCPSCDMARAYLQRRKVPFTEKNVEGNRVLLEELKKKAGSISVPTILVGEKVMQGFLESLLAGELDAAGYPPELPEGAKTGNEPTDAKPSP